MLRARFFGRLASPTTAALLAVGMLVPSGSVTAAEPITVSFASTGAEQSFVVPAGVTSVQVLLVGGRGGRGGGGAMGGLGAKIQGTLAVTPGGTLFVVVAGNGGDGTEAYPGFNGGGEGGRDDQLIGPGRGGGGGGASDIRTISRGDSSDSTLNSRLIVAAGGGGSGAGVGAGAAGDAGVDGGDGAGKGGAAGTLVSGGAGGLPTTNAYGGGDGALGLGGSGGRTSDFTFLGPGGAGGGGGFYGGGGGGGAECTADLDCGSGGGGGGSSFVGAATNTTVGTDTTGVPLVTITYVEASAGTVAAQVTVPTSAACLTLSVDSVGFGTQPLGAERQAASPAITVTNCSATSETLYARAGDATATGSKWVLDDTALTCNGSPGLAPNKYHLSIEGPSLQTPVALSTVNKTAHTLAAGASSDHTLRISTACPGSTGGGQTLTMQVVYLVTE